MFYFYYFLLCEKFDFWKIDLCMYCGNNVSLVHCAVLCPRSYCACVKMEVQREGLRDDEERRKRADVSRQERAAVSFKNEADRRTKLCLEI